MELHMYLITKEKTKRISFEITNDPERVDGFGKTYQYFSNLDDALAEANRQAKTFTVGRIGECFDIHLTKDASCPNTKA